MPYIYRDVDNLRKDHPLAGTGECVDLIKHYVPGLQGQSTSVWRAGANVMELGSRVAKGTAIANFVNGRYPSKKGNHAALVLKVMGAGIWVVDQWKDDPENRPGIGVRLIRVPPPHMQRNPDGSFIDLSNNALAFYVIEK